MATLRRKKAEPFSVFQRDPGPWPPILLNWMATLAIIMVFGLVMLFSASYTTGYLRFGDSFHYIKSQLLCTVLGLGMMFLFSYFDHRFLRRMVKLGYVVCLILLVLVLFSSPINGCRRWISFGGLTLQASEVAKFEMILLTADIAARTPQVKFGEVPLRKWVHHSIVVELIRPILWLVPVLILLVLEPHMSGILLTTAIVGTILLLGGSGGIITWGCAGAALFLLETLLKHVDSINYLQSRLDGWTQDLDRMTSQTKQSLYAIGSGGATGLGLGNSIEKQLWLPESTNDFIFSVVCEELGFVGAVIVIVLFVLFLVQGFWIAFHAENRFCTLVGIGIMAQIAWQVFCNIAVVTNTLPNTGISLPFFSSGGTSLILLLAEMGVMVNIGRNGERARLEREEAHAERERQRKAKTIVLDTAQSADRTVRRNQDACTHCSRRHCRSYQPGSGHCGSHQKGRPHRRDPFCGPERGHGVPSGHTGGLSLPSHRDHRLSAEAEPEQYQAESHYPVESGTLRPQGQKDDEGHPARPGHWLRRLCVRPGGALRRQTGHQDRPA